ncbi:formimidoylglutamate deiminase [Flexivirga oryzae]|uniref:Formiminoglutamate deiminase n=1 Tax=Flexivirga oryzae TaxID=1794944 RepID=A0A839N6B1_9MICO|nr:formimidoylglutamate deiminase [Flexivirga oryzae]MBB2893288.1 formiminoglutamate deiminase [Flexivirga oryzae]
MTSYWAEYALLPSGIAHDVRFTLAGDVFDRIEAGQPHGDAHRLPGVVLPGFANTHSHAFHRALRGRTHAEGGTFWTWRSRMYDAAARLTPDNYLKLARAAYAEMALSGITSVGEFHYVHHNPDGTPYDNPNAMGEALQQAARDAGVRLTLLDTCYLAGGLTADGHVPLEPEQSRFGDGDVSRWAERVSQLWDDATNRVGTAIHSVRAVPRDQLREFVQYKHFGQTLPTTHAHVSEQPAENEACLAFYGMTPVQLLAEAGVVDDDFTAVHATHLTDGDIKTLGGAASIASFCPTTERDLADGIGPSRELLDAGARLSLGSDQHAVIDMFEEVRGLESHERLRTLHRGRLMPEELLSAATAHDTVGWSEAGSLQIGAKADLVAVDLESPRTAGVPAEFVLTAATAADVTDVIRDGEVVVGDRQHRLGDVGHLLTDAINDLWEAP